jgi:myo-inositol-1(or 4)-monophosphatase
LIDMSAILNLGPAPTELPASLRGILPHVQEVVLEVGEFISREKLNFERTQAEIKGFNDLVSYVDRTAEQMLVEQFSRLLPDSGFINEETGSHNPDSEFVWVIDPLDGTTNFVFDVPVFCISVGLLWAQEPVAGYIYEPNRSELYQAVRGGGATRNGETIRVGSSPTLRDALVGTGFPFREFERLDGYLAMLREVMRRSRGIRRLGSAAMDLAYTGCGRFDGFFESHLKPWDVAAGAVIVREAGGVVTDYAGGNDWLFGGSIIAANPNVHLEMCELVEQYYRQA